jgi:hypothetical protein
VRFDQIDFVLLRLLIGERHEKHTFMFFIHQKQESLSVKLLLSEKAVSQWLSGERILFKRLLEFHDPFLFGTVALQQFAFVMLGSKDAIHEECTLLLILNISIQCESEATTIIIASRRCPRLNRAPSTFTLDRRLEIKNIGESLISECRLHPEPSFQTLPREMAENLVLQKLAELVSAGTPADEIAMPIFKRRQVYRVRIFGNRKLLTEVEVRVADVHELERIEREVRDFFVARKFLENR